MAIDTSTEQLALIMLGQVFQPNLPLSPGSLGQDDQQQLLWGYPGILWAEFTQPPEFEDLTTVFVPYVEALREASLLARLDSDSLIAADLPTIRAGADYDDLNTLYAAVLS